MKAELSPNADEDLDRMDSTLRFAFLKHVNKLLAMPPRRHLQHGVPFNVEDVTKQARFVYRIEGDLLKVARCFATHKEYEAWFKSFK